MSIKKDISQQKFQRDENGLVKGVKYSYKENGMIDWRKMINPEYLVFNQQLINEIQQKYQKPIKDLKVTEVDDKYLLILLAGMKEVAMLRGYESVTYDISVATRDFAAVSCEICWIPNPDSNNKSLIFQSLADAATDTVTGFGKNYILTCAENRAFVRAVRNACGIFIVGYDELGEKLQHQTNSTSTSVAAPVAASTTMLKSVLDEKKISFVQLKEKWVELGNDEAKKWNSLDDIPSETIFKILGKIKRK